MKKLFVILFGAAALNFQACKQGTPDADNTINDGMNTSETTIGTGSTRPNLEDDMNNNDPATANMKPSGIDDGLDSTNTEMGRRPIETGTLPANNE